MAQNKDPVLPAEIPEDAESTIYASVSPMTHAVDFVTHLLDGVQDLFKNPSEIQTFIRRLFQYFISVLAVPFNWVKARADPIYKKVEPKIRPLKDWALLRLNLMKETTESFMGRLKKEIYNVGKKWTDVVSKVPSRKEFGEKLHEKVNGIHGVAENKLKEYVSEERRKEYAGYYSRTKEFLLKTWKAVIDWIDSLVQSLLSKVHSYKLMTDFLGGVRGFLQKLRMEHYIKAP